LLNRFGSAGPALALLDRLDAAAASQQRAGSLIEIRAIRAMALAALGDEAGAVAALNFALDLGCPQGYVRVFADEGREMAAVLGRLVAAQRRDQRAARIPLACLARLQRAFDDGHPAGGGATVDSRSPRLIEQLTSRELEVLAMLAAGPGPGTRADRLGPLSHRRQLTLLIFQTPMAAATATTAVAPNRAG
jgi:MalT-like TPR region